MDFGILGPLEVRDGDRPVPLGGPRQRAILAILLTRANQVVPTERLIDELWVDDPPATATNVLQGYVSHLRKALGAAVLVTRPPGYAVEIDADSLDLHRFERLVEEGRRSLAAGDASAAAELLREALSLWRGPALADFAYEPFAQTEIARLEELRLAATERRIEADLALGRHAELIGEIERLVEAHPLQERPRAHLMLALYRAGRQAEALAAYRDARAALVDELGIEPGAALQELERAILRQDPALELARASGDAHPTAAALATDYPERSILVIPLVEESLDRLLSLAEALAQRPRRELIVTRLVPPHELAVAGGALEERRAALIARGVAARVSAFTSASAGDDVVLLATEQDVDLLLLDAPAVLVEEGALDGDIAVVLREAPCDVAIAVLRAERRTVAESGSRIVIPFGGAEHEWAAIEIGAWIAGAVGGRLALLGTIADPGRNRRDASRLLARAALMVQRVSGVPTESLLAAPGEDGVVEAAQTAGLLLVGLSPRWPQEGLGSVRHAVVRRAAPPTLLVRRGLRPGGLAPPGSLTRFTWTMASEGGASGGRG